jgi:hypothetical protein
MDRGEPAVCVTWREPTPTALREGALTALQRELEMLLGPVVFAALVRTEDEG